VLIHILNHHFWPDGSPSAVLEEELADTLRSMGYDTRLVAGSGSFHKTQRPAPASPVTHLPSGETGMRHSQFAILMDYWRLAKAVATYVRKNVSSDDVVLATSSPFLNVFLIRVLRRHAPHAATIFHLHDYLPSNQRSLSVIHRLVRPFMKWLIDRYLRQWGLVISCAGNIAYKEKNCVVARFWPTITKPANRHIDTSVKAALYAGNLSIAHNITALVTMMDELNTEGWAIDFYGDGPAMRDLPAYVRRHPFASGDEYIDVLYNHPLHLVCGVARDGTGAFPSKTMNSLYIGAEVRPCGFQPEMLAELEYLRTVPDLAANREYAAQVVDDYLQNQSR